MKTALIACGALAGEVVALKEKHGWNAQVFALPALLHNSPDRIPPAVLTRIREARRDFDQVVVVYGDCGTGGELDAFVERAGPKATSWTYCSETYGPHPLSAPMAREPGTSFLTDFL